MSRCPPRTGLEGLPALVTGAGQGVGRAIALTLADAGADVAINDVVESRADEVRDDIRERGGLAESAAFDVTDWDSVHAAVDRLEGVGILVNNAGNAGVDGFSALRPFVETDPAEWDRYIRVNLHGVMNCTRAALPSMISRNGGRIITIVSDAARYGDAFLAPVRGGQGRCGRLLSLDCQGGRPLQHHGQLRGLGHHTDADHDRDPTLTRRRTWSVSSSNSRSTSSGGRVSPKMSPVWWVPRRPRRLRGSRARPTRSMAAIPLPFDGSAHGGKPGRNRHGAVPQQSRRPSLRRSAVERTWTKS